MMCPLVFRSDLHLFFNLPATTAIYTLSLHDALPILGCPHNGFGHPAVAGSEVCTIHGGSEARLEQPRSEEHTSELQSRQYLVCRLLLEKKNSSRTASSCGCTKRGLLAIGLLKRVRRS